MKESGAEQKDTGSKAVSQLWDDLKEPLSLAVQWGTEKPRIRNEKPFGR